MAPVTCLQIFSLVVLDFLQKFHCWLFSVFHQVLELLLAQFPILHGIVFHYLDYGQYRYGAILRPCWSRTSQKLLQSAPCSNSWTPDINDWHLRSSFPPEVGTNFVKWNSLKKWNRLLPHAERSVRVEFSQSTAPTTFPNSGAEFQNDLFITNVHL